MLPRLYKKQFQRKRWDIHFRRSLFEERKWMLNGEQTNTGAKQHTDSVTTTWTV